MVGKSVCSYAAFQPNAGSRERSPRCLFAGHLTVGYQDSKGNSPTILNQAAFLDLRFLPGLPGEKDNLKIYIYFRPMSSVSMGNWTRGV